jgi:P27 family predicted phage terminase small subunit
MLKGGDNMAGQRQPIELVIAKGKKNLTKEEIKERLDSEVKPIAENIVAPDYLTKTQQKEFNLIASQLQKLKIMGETDIDALARYIIAKDLYIKLSRQIRKTSVINNPIALDKYLKNQDRVFKQCRSSANDLGLSISSRCKLVVPATNEEKPKENKFSKFEKNKVSNG